MKNTKNSMLIVIIGVIILAVIFVLFLTSGSGTMMHGAMN